MIKSIEDIGGASITTFSTSSILDQGEFEFWKTGKHGIRFLEETPQEEWLKAVKQLCDLFEGATHVANRSQLLLGDALNFGEDHYGEEYAQAIDGVRAAAGLEPKRLGEIMRVTKVIPATRRKDGLTIGHYDCLRSLDANQQDEMIALAFKEHLSVNKLRELVALQYPSKKGGKTRAKAKDASPSEMKATAKELSNWLTANEEKIDGTWKPILEHIFKLFRRQWMTGHKKK